MVRKKKVGPTARFGARYGTAPRKHVAEIEVEMKKLHECPKCESKSVKRLSVGVWVCRRCGYTFTGGAYTPFTKLGEISKRAAKGLIQKEAAKTE
jgi:large subunit ribosomal protein L37Ae